MFQSDTYSKLEQQDQLNHFTPDGEKRPRARPRRPLASFRRPGSVTDPRTQTGQNKGIYEVFMIIGYANILSRLTQTI